ncbi:MAG: endonuclease V [Planctomycetota bacterium]
MPTTDPRPKPPPSAERPLRPSERNPDPRAAEWIALQRRLAALVELPREDAGLPDRPRVLALDVQYAPGPDGVTVGHVGAALHRAGEGPRSWAAQVPVDADYVPGSFCFREGPPLVAVIEALRARGEAIDLVVVDGHGIAHPRRFGVACYVGLAAAVPALGCAKGSLLRWEGEVDATRLGPARGARQAVWLEGEPVGWALRTRDRVKPVFASPGHRLSLEQAAELALVLPAVHRVPEPLREADRVARASAAGRVRRGWRDLGELPPRPLEG